MQQINASIVKAAEELFFRFICSLLRHY